MRTVDVAAAISATEGICDITCDPEITVCKKGICKRGIYADYISDTICAVRDSVSGLVQKTEAKCLQHSDTAVICGTSAYSDNEMPEVVVWRGFLFLYGTNVMPAAEAISIMAVFLCRMP